MKTIRSFFNLLFFVPVVGFFFAGCYTHMETMSDRDSGSRDGDDYAYTDSTSASNDTTGANYFSDDDYRESQYRTSFDYYCPPAYMWGTNICYDPWYDNCWYPGSYWDGYYPYWGWGYGYGYGSYYGGGYRGGHRGNFFGGRLRTAGNTRGGDGFLRGRAAAGSPGAIPFANRGVSSGTRTQAAPVAAATTTSRSRQEVSWWQRAKSSTENSQNQSRVATRTQSTVRNASVANQRRNTDNPVRSGASARQGYQHRGRMQPARAGNAGSQSRQAVRQASPRSSPQGSSGRSGGSGGGRSGGGGGGRSGRSR